MNKPTNNIRYCNNRKDLAPIDEARSIADDLLTQLGHFDSQCMGYIDQDYMVLEDHSIRMDIAEQLLRELKQAQRTADLLEKGLHVKRELDRPANSQELTAVATQLEIANLTYHKLDAKSAIGLAEALSDWAARHNIDLEKL